ncbi:hypothetical protein [Rhizobium sp. MHM7A]|uniref:hypothetical protein n=1 Tax=Rhizobium sp. MHM7A TaxID=2583233 RepID=UPI0011074A91|nr:hypothetical protein [Rhizobium sp. MHM7A]TLX17193.1 hypothetical protein FFR93_07740 [Rhizobium sp. MHM7A]
MKSLAKFIPLRGLRIMCPAKGGQVIGPASLVTLMITSIMQLAAGRQTAIGNWMFLIGLVGIIYSIQFNPKDTPKSPMALGKRPG